LPGERPLAVFTSYLLTVAQRMLSLTYSIFNPA
jgi:hypothetical protein